MRALYREVYARIGAEDQLSFILPSPPETGVVVGVAINRAARGYSARDRELVKLVKPHLSQAFRDARLRSSVDPLAAERLHRLVTEREAEVIQLLATGRAVTAIAPQLSISPNTVRKHLAHIYAKLEVTSRAAAIARVLDLSA